MKQPKVLLLLSLLLMFRFGSAQRGFQNLKDYDYEPYHFGFLLGYNQMGFSLKQNPDSMARAFSANEFNGLTGQNAHLISVEPKTTSGFTIGIVGNLRLTNHFDLRCIPAIAFGERDLIYQYTVQGPSTPLDTITEPMSLKSTLLELPLTLKYKGNRINNARPYIISGLLYTRDLSSDAKKGTANQAGDLLMIKLKPWDLMAEVGAGFDLYFDWFKMGIEAKMSYGLRDIIYRDASVSMYNTALHRTGSKIFQLSFTFE